MMDEQEETRDLLTAVERSRSAVYVEYKYNEPLSVTVL